MITQDTLKERLHYEPSTGAFTWIKANGPATCGKKAGCNGPIGYVYIRILTKLYLAHRLAFLYMNGEMPEFCDHINRDKADNRWSNLRKATKKENNRNVGISKNNTSGYTGVCWDKWCRRWRARIKIDGKNKHLGMFTSKTDAAAAYKDAAIKYYGDFSPF